MKVSKTDIAAVQASFDAIVVGIASNAPLNDVAKTVDEATNGTLSAMIAAEEFSGKTGQVATLFGQSGISSPILVLTGLGEATEPGPQALFRAAGAAAKSLASKPRDKVAFYLGKEHLDSAVCGAMVGCHGQDLYRQEKILTPFEEAIFYSDQTETIARGESIGEGINLARELVNQPPSEIYPESFAEVARQVATESGLELEIWDQQRLESERCGSLLAVAQGSAKPARLVILKHMGGSPNSAPVALVGKGVTFDSGGLSLKPTDGMKDMKCDMAGAATVVGAMQTIAELNLPVNVVGLVGLVENLVSSTSYKLGDVLFSRNGKTIEVLNTDAEGRLVLADVLDVAVTMGATKIIDLATLTGACVVALGLDVAGVMTNDQQLCDSILAAGEVVGEPLWQLPMFKEFGEQIKSDVADIKNVGAGRWGGAITAAKFLEEFVGDTPWVHIDIAGPAFADNGKAWIDSGASGSYVRTLVQWVEQQA